MVNLMTFMAPPIGLQRRVALELLALVLTCEAAAPTGSPRAQTLRFLAGQVSASVSPLSYDDRELVAAARDAWQRVTTSEGAGVASSPLTEDSLSDAKEKQTL